jgi:hypothetical protein
MADKALRSPQCTQEREHQRRDASLNEGGEMAKETVPAGAAAIQRVGPGGGGGRPLPSALLERFEHCFGCDLSAIRVHTDGQAVADADAAYARAFTRGPDIFFAGAEYRPFDAEGQWLLAHELTHALQQRAVRATEFGEPALAGNISRARLGVVQLSPYKLETLKVEGNIPRQALPSDGEFVIALQEFLGGERQFGIGRTLPAGGLLAKDPEAVSLALEEWILDRTGLRVSVRIHLRRGSYRGMVELVVEVNRVLQIPCVRPPLMVASAPHRVGSGAGAPGLPHDYTRR